MKSLQSSAFEIQEYLQHLQMTGAAAKAPVLTTSSLT